MEKLCTLTFLVSRISLCHRVETYRRVLVLPWLVRCFFCSWRNIDTCPYRLVRPCWRPRKLMSAVRFCCNAKKEKRKTYWMNEPQVRNKKEWERRKRNELLPRVCRSQIDENESNATAVSHGHVSCCVNDFPLAIYFGFYFYAIENAVPHHTRRFQFVRSTFIAFCFLRRDDNTFHIIEHCSTLDSSARRYFTVSERIWLIILQ